MTNLSDVSVIIKTFNRPEKLRVTLESLTGKGFREVIVADDSGDNSMLDSVYEEFVDKIPLKVLKLPYDSGVGYGRTKAAEEAKSKYLLVIDDDMSITNVELLKEILESEKYLGGVGGCLIEYGKFRCFTCNFRVQRGYLIKYDPPIQMRLWKKIGYLEFDMIPNSLLIRKDVLMEYSWDPYYKTGFEHLDFFFAHKQLGKWKFAVVPSVLFFHYPGGDKRYVREYRFNKQRLSRSKRYFLKKWGLKGVVSLNNGISSGFIRRAVILELKKHLPLKLASLIG